MFCEYVTVVVHDDIDWFIGTNDWHYKIANNIPTYLTWVINRYWKSARTVRKAWKIYIHFRQYLSRKYSITIWPDELTTQLPKVFKLFFQKWETHHRKCLSKVSFLPLAIYLSRLFPLFKGAMLEIPERVSKQRWQTKL